MLMKLQPKKVAEQDPSPADSNLKLLEEEFKPKGNKLLSIIELWTRSKQGAKTLNEWLTYIHNLVEACNYGDSTDRIIRDALIISCESDKAKDKIIQRGETITLNEVIEILQTEASTNSTLRQFQEIQNKPVQQVNYVSYNSRSKKSKKPSNKQNSSSSKGSTGSKRQCFQCGEAYSRKPLEQCRAKNAKFDAMELQVTSRNVVTFQKIILIDKISLLPHVQAK